jgi:hypothetical protein
MTVLCKYEMLFPSIRGEELLILATEVKRISADRLNKERCKLQLRILLWAIKLRALMCMGELLKLIMVPVTLKIYLICNALADILI